ncbi:MAG: adenine phosphoribosyltransferase [Candidatus Zixiibacteriota bacterium]|nr:MAG: adenine phosphoribosyltransferase [candidate division Zixibacteria bacterium]
MEELKKYIRSVPDFPKPGINFYDITTLLIDPAGFKKALDSMESFVRSKGAQKIISIESRGFVFGAALADRLGIGLITARKPGKLPYKTIREEYDLEYGTDSLEIHSDSVTNGEKVVVVDDLIATGGTLRAVCKMIERLGGEVAGISVVIDLAFLPWREKLRGYDVHYLISYDSE